MAISAAAVANRWTQRRRRAQELREAWPFSAEVLGFYGALLDAQEAAWSQARMDVPAPADVISYTRVRVLPAIFEATVRSGPSKLVQSLLERYEVADFESIAKAWLDGNELLPVERYIARAAVSPVLEALGTAAGALGSGPRGGRHCPSCGGRPQLSYFAASSEELLTPQRYLECERCATSWPYTRMTCAACGESRSMQLAVFTEEGVAQAGRGARVVRRQPAAADLGSEAAAPEPGSARFAHMRIDGCRSCSTYVLTVDLGGNGRAVPVVDELAALPLDLYAKEQGLRKITPNLMGF
ncbi:MAG: hypothetical protein DLM53_00675 [Candidatus Eremiobacter antarcticus]|nr:formate dehydrogenase accessory protein FdhE [Candidatus Eremiobacteraeota bacterium]MBC5809046.1 formate dehydrogenase accessory protein FdhE [Candidatus Eremiobacteraeota bacterium]PZR64279.1 MAG: hypothetical protein DLM53_00675 [Candidatus Eremiobacter sp. RRmetagenome_bin22]